MFVSLVKIKKYLIYLFLFLFFNCLFTISLKAEPTLVDGTVVDDQGGDEDIKTKLGISKNIYGFDLGFNANQTVNKKTNQEAELILAYNF